MACSGQRRVKRSATHTAAAAAAESYADMRMTVMVCMPGTNFVTWRALVNGASNAALLTRRLQQQQPRWRALAAAAAAPAAAAAATESGPSVPRPKKNKITVPRIRVQISAP